MNMLSRMEGEIFEEDVATEWVVIGQAGTDGPEQYSAIR